MQWIANNSLRLECKRDWENGVLTWKYSKNHCRKLRFCGSVDKIIWNASSAISASKLSSNYVYKYFPIGSSLWSFSLEITRMLRFDYGIVTALKRHKIIILTIITREDTRDYANYFDFIFWRMQK